MFLESGDHGPDGLYDTAASTQSPRVGSTRANVAAFGGTRTDWQNDARRHFARVMRLPKGWDGYRGQPVAPAIGDYAFLLLERLMMTPRLPLPIITPLPYGGMILEWHRRGLDVELEIESPGRHRLFVHRLLTDKSEEWLLGADLKRLASVVGQLTD